MYKKVYDPVHGFIRFSSLEKELIDSYAFRRLHYIRQLGMAHLVYPGASHTRFEHSLGVMEVATQIFDKITEGVGFLKPKKSLIYWRQVVRFAALCHDLGHLPFSHLAESRLLGVGGHEKWTATLIESRFFQTIWDKFQEEFPGESAVSDIIKIALGEEKYRAIYGEKCFFSSWEKVMSQIIAGDFFGADRIDYLLRDARCTGVSYGLFDYHQLIEMLQILPTDEAGLSFGVEENGIASCEALLLARHFMHRRVYQHPSVQAYSLHMARFMEQVYAKEDPLASVEKYLAYTDDEVSSSLRKAFLNKEAVGHADACAIFMKEKRFLAYELPAHITEEAVATWQQEEGIEEGMVELAFSKEKKESCVFTFPAIKGGEVIDAALCSEITVPSFQSNWLYVEPSAKESLKALHGASFRGECV